MKGQFKGEKKKRGGGPRSSPEYCVFLLIYNPNRWAGLMIYWWRAFLHNKAASFYSPRRRRCHLLGIWVGTGPHVKSPTDLEDESDTALLCCIPLGHRPLRRFKVEDAAFCWEERCCWRWRRLDLGPDLNKLWVMRAGSGPFISRRLWGWRIGRLVSYPYRIRETIINLCAAGRCFRVAVRRPS